MPNNRFNKQVTPKGYKAGGRAGKMGGGMMKRTMLKDGTKLKMVTKNGKKVPFFAADGKGSKDLGKGAIHYADGMLYCLGESDGTVALVKASPKGWQESSRFKLSPQTKLRKPSGKIWTHPVVIGGKLYLRDQEIIYCYNVKS